MPENLSYRSIEEAIAQHPNQPRRYLLGFEPANGRSIISVGNPDLASHTGVLVPGAFANAGSHLGYMEVARRFQWRADDALGPHGSAAVVAWQNYPAPQSIFPGAARDDFAESGALRLRDFLDRLDHTSEMPETRRTVIGHSYGAVVVGQAAQGAGLNTHSLVTLGGAGVHARTVQDPKLQEGPPEPGTAPAWALIHPDDPIRFLEPVDRTSIGHGHVHTHAYWEPGGRSLDIIGEIIAGIRR
ncbi:alpha/beta hydrolase [Mycobacteroides abscessus]|uniref:alpha/beta hydrolase n=1 Tax=Mycobacteroides abscessus TaxID=36809 RepID=UPI0005E420C7|nr:alpha/beta hydrolase [Mycobacteroides abscessus]CPW67466.1 Alpha/beta hydrolase of uncharacterised function (DUF1023) [Mycobacteroides abscessus]SKF62013.1 Alpha/beta hydrolase of uncharacterised function (DUF1023) [Mycobacteroides abscessus subsp. bolletii]SKH90961.1 Alpha/beta hydrolase of uncharacterised function (DUF1023) [Mycobacteroides abscessus subsp. bolletii]